MLKKVSGRQFALSLLIVVVFGYSFGKDLALKENKKDGIHADMISGNE